MRGVEGLRDRLSMAGASLILSDSSGTQGYRVLFRKADKSSGRDLRGSLFAGSLGLELLIAYGSFSVCHNPGIILPFFFPISFFWKHFSK